MDAGSAPKPTVECHYCRRLADGQFECCARVCAPPHLRAAVELFTNPAAECPTARPAAELRLWPFQPRGAATPCLGGLARQQAARRWCAAAAATAAWATAAAVVPPVQRARCLMPK